MSEASENPVDEQLSEHNSELSHHEDDEVPALRFASGNVIIKLGRMPKEWLLLHSDIIETMMPALGAGMTERWADCQRWTKKVHSDTGAEVGVYMFGLKFVDNTYILEGEDFDVPVTPCNREDGGVSFHDSDFANGAWPASEDDPTWWSSGPMTKSGRAIDAHRVLFALVYGSPLSFKALLVKDYDKREIDKVKKFAWRGSWLDFIHAGIDQVVSICAYAEYYGCHARIAPLILDMLFARPAIWQLIASRPLKFATIGKKLQSPQLFFEAMRHLISQDTRDWEDVGELLGISAKEAEACFLPRLYEQSVTVHDLQNKLTTLQLSHSEAMDSGHWYDVATTWLNALSFKSKRRGESEKGLERADFLARAVYGQWLAQRLVGRVVYRDPKTRSAPAGPFNHAVLELEQAAASFDAAPELFGKHASERISRIFKLGRKENGQRVKRLLGEIVQQAAHIISTTFETHSVEVDDKRITYRRCEFDIYEDTFTYLAMDEDGVPWQWSEGDSILMPEVNRKDASDEVVQALGGHVDDGAEEDSLASESPSS